MKCLPFYINGKYQIARFGDKQSYTPTFIIEKGRSNILELFHFEKYPYAFDTLKGIGKGIKKNEGKDYSLEIIRDKCKIESVDDSVKLTLSLKTKTYNSSQNVKDTKIEHFEVKNGKVLVNIDNIIFDKDVVSVVVYIVLDDKEFCFRVNIAAPDKIWDIIIDFGSEASQIWTACRGGNDNQNRNNQVPLFHNICESFLKEELEKLNSVCQSESALNNKNEFYQYDADNENLYKSLFFLSSSLSNTTITSKELIRLNKISDLMTMLQQDPNRNDGMPRYISLPNLKLMHHGEVSLPRISVNGHMTNLYQYLGQLRNEILMFFVKVAFDQLDSTINGQKVACVTLLVPNTYSQGDLTKTRKEMTAKIEHLLSHSESERNICPYSEVNTFSESDASFLGFFRGNRLNKLYPKKYYLIIDIGKGTTDFSVLQMKDDGVTSVCLAKSGIIGAGNVMTFATLASVLNCWATITKSSKEESVSPEKIRSLILRLVNTTDRAKKNKLYRLVEKLKCNNINGGQHISEFINHYIEDKNIKISDFNSLNIDGLIAFIESACDSNCCISDDDIVMTKYADIVANMIVKELKFVYHEFVMPIDYLIMTGRGAKCTPLYFAIVNKIRGYNPNLEVFTFTDIELKTSCLRGPLNNAVKLENLNIVGWPMARRKGEKTSISRNNLLSKLTRKDEGFANEIGANNSVSTLQGHKESLNSQNDIFSLGNRKYRMEQNGDEQNCPKDLFLFFDGEDFVLRSETGSYALRELPGEERFTLLYETLFPVTENNGNAREMQEHAFTELLSVLGKKQETPNVPSIDVPAATEPETPKRSLKDLYKSIKKNV